MDIKDILREGVSKGCSDIHIVPTRRPIFRVNGEMIESQTYEVLSGKIIKDLLFTLLNQEQQEKFDKEWEFDSSFQIPGLARFRINMLMQKDGPGAVFRVIPTKIPTPQDLNLPQGVVELTKLAKGFVLVTGPTGSGKSTTLASLINVINETRQGHIITIEDPIEFAFEQKKCIITQREVGGSTRSFAAGLKYSLRQDPDVILVGEMRDIETIGAAITLAETGHLVFATLHTNDAPQTIDRIIDVFPPYQQSQIRTQLASSIKAILCQQLLPRLDGKGRVAAREIMYITPGIANLIREGKTAQLYSSIDMGGKMGMISLDKVLAELVQKKIISLETALPRVNNITVFNSFVGKV